MPTPLPVDGLTTRLDVATREFLEEGFGQDFQTVQVVLRRDWRPGEPVAAATADRVILAESCYQPDTRAGLHLLAHEFAHVAQKRLDVNQPAAMQRVEAEAESAARSLLAGQPVRIRTADAPGVPRFWGEAGHYYTAYFVLLAAGADWDLAFHHAVACQLPDEVDQLDATHHGINVALTTVETVAFEALGRARSARQMDRIQTRQEWEREQQQQRLVTIAMEARRREARQTAAEVQEGLHCLTGRDSGEETALRTRILRELPWNSFEFGLAIHPYGDSFAHRTLGDSSRMYSGPAGHAIEGPLNWHAPDHIHERPDVYQKYARGLYDIVLEKIGGTRQPLLSRDELNEKLVEITRFTSDAAQIRAIRRMATRDLCVIMNDYAPENEDLSTWDEFRMRHPRMAEHLLQLARQSARNWFTARP